MGARRLAQSTELRNSFDDYSRQKSENTTGTRIVEMFAAPENANANDRNRFLLNEETIGGVEMRIPTVRSRYELEPYLIVGVMRSFKTRAEKLKEELKRKYRELLAWFRDQIREAFRTLDYADSYLDMVENDILDKLDKMLSDDAPEQEKGYFSTIRDGIVSSFSAIRENLSSHRETLNDAKRDVDDGKTVSRNALADTVDGINNSYEKSRVIQSNFYKEQMKRKTFSRRVLQVGASVFEAGKKLFENALENLGGAYTSNPYGQGQRISYEESESSPEEIDYEVDPKDKKKAYKSAKARRRKDKDNEPDIGPAAPSP